MNEFTVKSSTEQFQIKQMNAIEILALRTQFSYDSVESTTKLFGSILERIEVKCDNAWLPAKTSGRDVYFPDGLQNDVIVVQ